MVASQFGNVVLNISERFGREIIDLAQTVDFAAHREHRAKDGASTEIVYMSYYHSKHAGNGWEPLDNTSTDKTCVLHPVMFQTIAASAITQALTGKDVAIILFYKPSILAMQKFVHTLCTMLDVCFAKEEKSYREP